MKKIILIVCCAVFFLLHANNYVEAGNIGWHLGFVRGIGINYTSSEITMIKNAKLDLYLGGIFMWYDCAVGVYKKISKSKYLLGRFHVLNGHYGVEFGLSFHIENMWIDIGCLTLNSYDKLWVLPNAAIIMKFGEIKKSNL